MTDGRDLGKQATARYATGDGIRIVGTIVGYAGRPMVCIRAADGTQEWWMADLVTVAEEPAT